MVRLLLLLLVALLLSVALEVFGAEAPRSPLSPAEAIEQFELDPALAIELVACEPEVVDPIAIRFDEDGRLWVVEMRDYPHGPTDGQQPLSTIRILADEDGDGRYETSRLFADQLLFPTGVQPWRGGAIVTLAGEVAYLKDTDGDGKADVCETWYRGFTIENPQLRANHPRLGLDNRVYVANGLRGGVVVDPRLSESTPLSISGMDFCFDPLTFASEAVSGNGQFGMALDDYGQRFVCNNRVPLDQVILGNRYLARNPFQAVPATVAHVAAEGEQSHVYPLTSAWTTSNLHAGQFTAACGVEIFRGDALGPAFRGNAFTCEPTGSLVHREIVERGGVAFTSRPAYQGKEFLASRDPWCRPVNLEVGPDGALYVVDMYRAVIEHPQYMPTELQKRSDLRLGDDRGRIYRVVAKNRKPKRERPRLSKASVGELAALLRHSNGWWQETAGRLLLERQDVAAVPSVEAVAASADEPVARARALWVLSGLKSLSDSVLAARLEDRDPRVREQAVLLAESRIAELRTLRQRVQALASDADARVRFRVALAIGGVPGPEVVTTLAAVGLASANDPWTRAAVGSALPEHAAGVLSAVAGSPRSATIAADSPVALLVRDTATIVGSRLDASELAGTIQSIGQLKLPDFDTVQRAAVLGLAQGVARRGGRLVDLVGVDAAAGESAVGFLTGIFDRTADLELLRYDPRPATARKLFKLVSTDDSPSVRLRAAAALSGQGDEGIAAALIEAFDSQSPAVRRAIVESLSVHPVAARKLLESISGGRINRADLGAATTARLLQHGDEQVRALAQKVLAPAIPADRKAVLADYQSVLKMTGDPRQGKTLFRQHCAVCHQIGDVGVNVAPDISDSRVKTQAQLLTDILNPNQAIDNNYVSYTIATHDGRIHTGIIAAETPSSLTLKQQEGKVESLLRADIETLRSNGVSLMPDGFEKHLNHQQMADVIAFVKNWRYLEQPAPGVGENP